MSTAPSTKRWMIAAWPGMGSVAIIAAGYLVDQLGLREFKTLPPDGFVDVKEVSIRNGLVEPPQLPRGVFFQSPTPPPGQDLIVFIGESQPTSHIYDYANALVSAALQLGIERIVTFASLASGLHPTENPKVWGFATNVSTLLELQEAGVDPVSNGQIGGLNGLILGAAVTRGIAGFCLLAEIPYFAIQIPNPKAARAALSVLSIVSGLDISLEDLNKQADFVDKAISDAMEKAARREAQESTAGEGEFPAASEGSAEQMPTEQSKEESPASQISRQLTNEDREKIAALFEAARKDLSRAVELKKELDRLQVFSQYESTFLDLFRRAG